MKHLPYFIDDQGRICSPQVLKFSNEKYNNEETFEIALEKFLAEFRAEVLDLDKVRPSPLLYADLKLQHHLDIEDGLALATGLAIDIAIMSTTFNWRNQTFYPVRPDLNILYIVNEPIVEPFNIAERETVNFLSAFSDCYRSLTFALEAGELFIDERYTFDWWLEFWNKRGIDVTAESHQEQDSSRSPRVKSSHMLAIAGLLELLLDDKRPRYKQGSAAEAIEAKGWRGASASGLTKLFAEARATAAEADKVAQAKAEAREAASNKAK
ncbi:MAG: hypothetical protein KJ989_02890 [Gammaproteobacteria bacterium]|nr:hypothetical protein [Gammaproteobacteria bacterium]MBU2155042.1 hypothetical protein [Gammaproteobacteria bacterium]MBU2255495.1 hypothetical protein [Gammaproteobacteria bacterium]MBU2293132.1 hypothetical protein [Gammaproteobacteria bacterium]